MNGEYSINQKAYRFPTSTHWVYVARVAGPNGWWKSKEFEHHSDALAWCLNRLRDQCLPRA